MRTDQYIKVAAGIIEKDGKVPIARRRKGKALAGYWEFPGGKLEEGEAPEEALCRELKEEFTIQVEVQGHIMNNKHHYEEFAIELMFYKVGYVSGKFELKDHDQIEWVEKSVLGKYQLAPADIPVLDKL